MSDLDINSIQDLHKKQEEIKSSREALIALDKELLDLKKQVADKDHAILAWKLKEKELVEERDNIKKELTASMH